MEEHLKIQYRDSTKEKNFLFWKVMFITLKISCLNQLLLMLTKMYFQGIVIKLCHFEEVKKILNVI
jgi:hypothetical protein